MGMKADYGVDAPSVIRNLALAGIASIAAGLGLNGWFSSNTHWLAVVFLVWGSVAGLGMLLTSALMLWGSKVGKLRERERLLDSLELRGDEIVLDVGCGRGLLLNGAARRLPRGKAIGVDLWRSEDESDNRIGATLSNAEAEGVRERVDVRTGDMRELPLPDSSVDIVVSSLAIHNIGDEGGRVQAVREVARVLKPGGRVALLDFQCTDEYARTLADLGWRDVQRSPNRFGMFPPVRVVTGTKPA
jgi:SAM-dependent methyltransferase